MKLERSEANVIIDMLQKSPLWSTLSERELGRIIELAKERKFESGDVIVRKGDTGLGFYLMLDGSAEVRADGKTLSHLGKSDFFGEMSLLDDQPRTADVVALGPSRCLVLTVWSFKAMISRNPKIALKLLQEFNRRLRATNQVLTE